jgi:hypothetical protein
MAQVGPRKWLSPSPLLTVDYCIERGMTPSVAKAVAERVESETTEEMEGHWDDPIYGYYAERL